MASILVIDDDALNREIMEAFLDAHRVIMARDGHSGLQQARAQVPDLILLDAKMPDLSGYAVCQQLKADAQTAHIPVLMITGYNSEEDRQSATQAGADAFLTRPFDAAEFLELVRVLLG